MKKVGTCLFAEDVLYETQWSVWVRLEGDLAVVGIDPIMAWLGGPFSSVSFKEPGAIIERGVSLGSVEAPRHFDVVRAPLTCRLVEPNAKIRENPKLLNHDPFGSGWFVRVEVLRPDEELGSLLALPAARESLGRRIEDLHVRCFSEFPDSEMFEIGSECAGILVKLDELMSRSPCGTVVHLVSDDPTAEVELIGWAERTHNSLLETTREGNLFHFIVKKA